MDLVYIWWLCCFTSTSQIIFPCTYNNTHISTFIWRDKGACGGELACSTCHLVFDQEVYDTLPPKSDEEEDMLDLAFELTET